MIDAPAAGEASGNQEQRQRSGGNQDQSSQFFNNLKDKVGTIAGNPMTREEALKILNIEEQELQSEEGFA